jgi:squalene/oxidosqualene cyclase-like protein
LADGSAFQTLAAVAAARDAAATHLVHRQGRDGAWEGEVVWCPIITAEVVFLDIALGLPITAERKRLILHHFAVTRRSGGGWGLHPASAPYLFVTTLVYVAARLLGEEPGGPLLSEARQWLAAQPSGVWGLPQWGKIWLALLGLYDRRGLYPCPPELFLLPRRMPGSPTRLYCHTRYIYLGLAYLVGSGFVADLGPIGQELRRELYGDGAPEEAVRHRHDLACSDAYRPIGAVLRRFYDAGDHVGRIWRRLPGAAALRRYALDVCYRRIRYEQTQTGYQGLSPVNGILNTLAIGVREPGSAASHASRGGVEAWRWQDEAEGIRYAGARSTTWDTTFAMRALLAMRARDDTIVEALRRGYRRLGEMQLIEELENGAAQDRDPIAGGWCFSDGAHRWPVSDCTAEALSAVFECHAVPGLILGDERISPERLRAAANFIMARQNGDGGFATYERRRGGRLLERLNPSQMFGNCMTELSYVECTASAVETLVRFAESEPSETAERAQKAVDRGLAYLLERQRSDGAWTGFWGINLIYGTRFAVAGLRAAGLPPAHSALRRAGQWLRSMQHPDGGWGEDFSGCLSREYVDRQTSLVISTAWAVLALLDAEEQPSDITRRGVAWLAAHQDGDGDWPRDGVNGVFFGTAMLDYRLYNTSFPALALARFEARAHDHD